jgi:hypothetical protein
MKLAQIAYVLITTALTGSAIRQAILIDDLQTKVEEQQKLILQIRYGKRF